MTIKEDIAQIINKRNAKVPLLEEKKTKLQNILSQVKKINLIRENMLDNADKLNMGHEVKTTIQSISTIGFENRMEKLIKSYSDTIDRFSRNEINIAVVGSARQGKSQLLQSISNLDNNVIPAFANNDCTGASSIIKNVPGSTLRADITFRSEFDMADAVQAYLDNIFGKDYKKLGSFTNIKKLSVTELEKAIPKGSAKQTKFEHLKKYIEHFDEWSNLVTKGHITVTDSDEIQKYVAQHNGEKENSPLRKNYFYYLAVKEAVISCEFNNPDTGSIVLRDTIGLGDTSLGISDKMLKTIGSYSDAAIIVRRPETATGKLDESDESLYDDLNKAFNKRNMGKWLFWLINRTSQNSPYGDNSDRCEAFKSKLDSFDWNIAQSFIVNAADKNEVNNDFLPSILRTLIDNIDAVDDGIIAEIQELADKAYSEFRAIQDMIRNILLQGATDVIDTTDFLDNRWDELYDSGFMKLLKDYKKELYDKKDEECTVFKNKVIDILKNSVNLLPSEETLLKQLQKGGNNHGLMVYKMRMDKFRTEFTREFINIDEEIFDEQVALFKSKVVDILASDEGGKLGNLPSEVDYKNAPEKWLIEFAEKYFNNPRYEQLKVSFILLANFSLTVRGFLMHRIRDRIDWLNPTAYDEENLSSEDQAKKINLIMKRKLKDVKEELLQKFQDELFREPNRVFYAILSEFYDRINFSYQANMKSAEKTWEKFYGEHLHEIWSKEFQDDMKLSELYKDWSELSDSLSKITKLDFSSNI